MTDQQSPDRSALILLPHHHQVCLHRLRCLRCLRCLSLRLLFTAFSFSIPAERPQSCTPSRLLPSPSANHRRLTKAHPSPPHPASPHRPHTTHRHPLLPNSFALQKPSHTQLIGTHPMLPFGVHRVSVCELAVAGTLECGGCGRRVGGSELYHSAIIACPSPSFLPTSLTIPARRHLLYGRPPGHIE